MQPLHIEATCVEEGVLTLRNLPIQKGDDLEVLVIPRNRPVQLETGGVLNGSVISYEDPFEPIDAAEWESGR